MGCNVSTAGARRSVKLLALATVALTLVASGITLSKPALGAPAPATVPPAVQGLDRVALGFEANQGQTDPRVRFLARVDAFEVIP